MPTARYQAWFDAIRAKRRVFYLHDGKAREGCPHVLGLDKNGVEKVLVCRVVPGRAAAPQWRCLFVSDTVIAGPAHGPWLEGASHTQRNSCVVDVHIDVNRKAEQRFDWSSPKQKSAKSSPAAGTSTKKNEPKKKKPRTR